MSDTFFIKQLPNGLTLLGQHMPHVSSAALTLATAAGSAYDPPGGDGAASVAQEWCLRGAGPRDTRQLHEALDHLGCQHSESVQSSHMQFSTAQLGRNLAAALEIFADIIRRPRMEDANFEPSRDLIVQDLDSLEDEPARKCNMLLREQFYPWPLGRCVYGRRETLAALTPQSVRDHLRRSAHAKGAIASVAGNIDWDAFVELMEKYFGDWQSGDQPSVELQPQPQPVRHVQKDSAQFHIALAYPSVTISHPLYYAARVTEAVLSGGMSSRLFTEVREKRGLVYHVSLRYHSLKDKAGYFVYAGTTPEKAQQTFDVTVGELRRIHDGLEKGELERAKTQIKAALVMQGESTSSRSTSMASDWYHLERLRSLQELSDAVDAVTADDVLAYVETCPARAFTVLVIGPQPLDTSSTGDNA